MQEGEGRFCECVLACLLAGWLPSLAHNAPPYGLVCRPAGARSGEGEKEGGGAPRRSSPPRRVLVLCVHEASGVRCAKEGEPCAASRGIHADPWPHKVRRGALVM